jgi:hypothetical protein
MIDMGQGFVAADCILAVVVTFCALAHLAILRAPDLVESETVERVRYIKIGGFAILAIRFWFVIWSSGGMLMPIATEIGLLLVFGAELYRTVYRLFQHAMDLQEERRTSKHRRKVRT